MNGNRPWPSALTRLLLLGLALAGGLLGQQAPLLQRLDNQQYDLFHRLAGQRRPAAHSLLITVDHQPMPGEAKRPLLLWGPRYAAMIARLRQAGVAAIGLDYLPQFSAEAGLEELPEAARQAAAELFDRPLQAQLASGGVVLPSLLTLDAEAQAGENLPHRDYLFALLASPTGRVGVANLAADPQDGVVRAFIGDYNQPGQEPRLSFAAALTQMAGLGSDPIASATPIGYLGPPGTIPRISRQDLLQADPASPIPQGLKGKIAIIAAEHPGNQDLHQTPYGLMNGAEIQAQIVETLISGQYPRPAGLWPDLASALGLLLLAAPLLQRISPWYGILLLPALWLAAFGLGYAAFLHELRLAPALSQLSLLLAYLGALALRFSRQERARQHIYRLLSRYVSEPVAKRIARGDQLPQLGGETLQVTILFSDIRGFTTLSERLSPAEVVELLNAYFSRVCSLVIDNGGAIDKFIGDALMAVFGAPEPSPDHARRALDSARSMVRQAEAFDDWLQQRFPGRGLAPFRIGVGLHTGLVVAGNIGAELRMDYTVIGDAVNVAARLEGQCKELDWPIVASQETLTAAETSGQVGEWQSLQVKGRQEPVVVGRWLGQPSIEENADETGC